MKENVGTKCKSKLIPVAKIHTACLILTNFDIKKLLSFLNIEYPWLKKSLFLCEKTNLVASSNRTQYIVHSIIHSAKQFRQKYSSQLQFLSSLTFLKYIPHNVHSGNTYEFQHKCFTAKYLFLFQGSILGKFSNSKKQNTWKS